MGANDGMAFLGLTPYAENNGVMRLELNFEPESCTDGLRTPVAVAGRELNVTDAIDSCRGSCFNFPEALALLDLGRSSIRRRLSLMFFCLTVGKPMFMFVV